MKKTQYSGAILSGGAAGVVNGLFGAGGGMVLVPLLCALTDLEDNQVFPASVSIILPACLVSLFLRFDASAFAGNNPFYLLGSALGGILAGFLARKIPTLWLHRALGVLILWGGVRYLW